MSIFKAYDIRGIYSKDLDDPIMERIGKSLGAFMAHKTLGNTICLGYDIRESSKTLTDAFLKGVTSVGIDVLFVGRTALGSSLYTGYTKKTAVSAFITASHLPAEWNGIKFFYSDGVGFKIDENALIEKIFNENIFEKSNKIGTITKLDPYPDYFDYMSTTFDIKRKLKVVVDCGGGSMCFTAPNILKSNNLDVIKLFCDVDPHFSKRPSEPKEENLSMLTNKVLSEKADFGVAFDCDGDRAVIVDNKGHVIGADIIASILAKAMLDQGHKGTVILNVECSMLMETILKPLGVKILRIPVGHTYMSIEAKKIPDALICVESSGHFVYPRYFLLEDGLMTPLKVAELLSNGNQSLSERISELPVYPKKRINFVCADNIKFKVIENLKTKLKAKYENINTLDGVRIDFDNGWILLRASNTEPQIRITSEAKELKILKNNIDVFSKILEETIKSCD
ncbi:MAG: phosphomannomutase/phosphoglucomutase [DPANN group archaeon]|nr:phosphomannomutase/phosphoglucomutase [DPANN group archaeon]